MVDIEDILERVAAGDLPVGEAHDRIVGYTAVGDFARLDSSRARRTGFPEVILGEGKPPDQLAAIARAQLDESGHVILTRVEEAGRARLEGLAADVDWHERSGVLVLRSSDFDYSDPEGTVAVISGGTSDLPVAEEAAVVARELGCAVETRYDIGVAGVHRLLVEVDDLAAADCLVAAAGREGSLPTVAAGLVDTPVIGLPVSTGYGYGGGGEAALLGMLQSCTVLSVVNIDAGFVAGAQAARIARSGSRSTREGQ